METGRSCRVRAAGPGGTAVAAVWRDGQLHLAGWRGGQALPAELQFERYGNGSVSGLVLHRNGRIRAEKVK